MNDPIGVGLGEIAVSQNPLDILVAYGLGSCLGIGMYDSTVHVAGLLHAVLPEHMNGSEIDSPKYVDSGVRILLEKMIKAGARQERIVLRMAGGANMLVSAALSKTFDIGTRNIASAHKVFDTMRLRLSSEEVGGTTGRTVRLYVQTGKMTIRMIGGQEREI